ncbi:MAG: phosphoribosylglycinamide formyltransferase [Planctomycetota bacterium]
MPAHLTPSAPLLTPPKPKGGPLKLAVLISGGGTTLVNLQDKIDKGQLHAKIVLVICSNPKAAGIARAQRLKLPVKIVSRRRFKTTATYSDAVFKQVRESRARLVCLAGFLSLLKIPRGFRNRVLNIHPSLLPAFGGQGMFGHHVHEAVLTAGVRFTGCTVHLADDTYDTGPILVQRTCPVLPNDTPDTLAARVYEQECLAYPEAIEAFAQRQVIFDPDHNPPLAHATLPRDLVHAAYDLCISAHHGQTRAGAKKIPYATHPIAVYNDLLNLGVTDPDLLAAALLHDVLEDTPITSRQLTKAFGPRVTGLVKELTLPPSAEKSFIIKHRTLCRHARKMTPDAKLIKIADRRHNLLELHHKPISKRKRYGEATLALLDALKPWPALATPYAEHVTALAQYHASGQSTVPTTR